MLLRALHSSPIFRWFIKILKRPDRWILVVALVLFLLSACLLNTWPAASYGGPIMLGLAVCALIGIITLGICWYRRRKAGQPGGKALKITLVVLFFITVAYGFFGWYSTGYTTKEIATVRITNHSYHLVSFQETGCTSKCDPGIMLYHCDGSELICPFVPGFNLDCACRSLSYDYRSVQLRIDPARRFGQLLTAQSQTILKFNLS